MERIIRAVVVHPSGKKFAGACHTDCYDIAWEKYRLPIGGPGVKERFLTSEGRLLDRIEAGKVAATAGQIGEPKRLESWMIPDLCLEEIPENIKEEFEQ